MTQKFKGDDLELKMEAAASPALMAIGSDLDAFLADGYDAEPFLLMLYDEGRMPFSNRVPRDSFVQFIREALIRFTRTGTFESYLFIIQKIFGEGSSILFDIPGPGQLDMLVNASSSVDFDFVVREVVDGIVTESLLTDSNGAFLEFTGISGIDSEYELGLLLSEIIPAGIFPDVTLAFFSLYDFVSDDGAGGLSNMEDYLGNQIIFIENGAP